VGLEEGMQNRECGTENGRQRTEGYQGNRISGKQERMPNIQCPISNVKVKRKCRRQKAE
jgi:hypothetical protein